MRKFIYIISLMMLSSALASCSNETKALDAENTQLKAASAELSNIEKRDTIWLKDQALYQFEAVEGSDEYTVFIYADDEQATLNEDKNASSKNQAFTGDYSLYLAEKGSDVAYKQAEVGRDDTSAFTFNPSLNQAYSINLDNNTIIVVLQPNENGSSKVYLYTIKDGELKKISTEDKMKTIFGTEIKVINQNYLQTAHLQENKVWKFITWEYNEAQSTINKLDESQLNEKEISEGEDWYQKWSEQKEFYYPFHNIELSSDIVEKAKHGIPLGSPYPIGTNIANIKKSEPNFMEEGFIKETPYLMYPEITYYYEKSTGTVTAVSIPGERVKTTIENVKQLLGKPDREEKTSEGETQSVYNADKYIVEILSGESGKVSTIYLAKK
ncbi:hypothetical protein [Bacillus sp. S/N-304-OC-R1]|uniref:hypothetical protein n=1 Tax=Bacillus sp. S/N-304-OC-R1 TaxID=2758034 RepID=UPI001C8E320C|nr:hypothetical protein [Bacillus sp. S/N-304-OC-R1]MBY0122975.1 hypothetical protein [Bacillus sp. S/N-304-OC-R1]